MIVTDLDGITRDLYPRGSTHIFIHPYKATDKVTNSGIILPYGEEYGRIPPVYATVVELPRDLGRLFSLYQEDFPLIDDTIIFSRHASQKIIEYYEWESSEYVDNSSQWSGVLPNETKSTKDYIRKELHVLDVEDVEAVFS